MSDIRHLTTEGIRDFANIAINAYPGFKINTEEGRQRLIDRLVEAQAHIPVQHLVGLYREGKLVGGMRLHDFRMNLLGVEIDASGVGMVAVDLLHRKEHVAKELLAFFLQHYRQQGAPLALLYPFRPDFYYAMGFGYGTKMSQYRFHPAALRRGVSKAHVRFLTVEDKDALMACYNRYQTATHGMIVRYPPEWDGWFTNLGVERRLVGYVNDGRVEGYILFNFKARPVESPLRNDLVIREFVVTSREALGELLTFLSSQADQVDRIVLTTTDETFHHLLSDPRNAVETLIPSVYHESNVQGVGLMARVLDVPGMFRALAAHNFNGQNLRLRLTMRDSFLPENDGSVLITFQDGRATLPESGPHDAEIMLDVAEFSSLLIGAVDFQRLYDYNLAEISDPAYVQQVSQLFAAPKPICLTDF
ncbi:MAG: GNAT family N-acetyltransferase [Anaerolineae bacterium]|nr:GNAT family N-acetyltransferase [Anaerolineae bacterium]